MKGIKTTVALTPAEKECLVLYLILLVAFVVQRNAQGISPLRQYLCHHAARISEATSVFYIFRCWDRDWTYLSKKRDPREACQFFGNDLLHRSSLGIGWRRASRLCSVPQDVSGHKKESKEVPAAERGITLQDSIQILELTKNLVPVGSGKRLQWVMIL